MFQYIKNFVNDRRAVTSIEYVLITTLLAVIIVGVVTSLGHNTSSTFCTVSEAL